VHGIQRVIIISSNWSRELLYHYLKHYFNQYVSAPSNKECQNEEHHNAKQLNDKAHHYHYDDDNHNNNNNNDNHDNNNNNNNQSHTSHHINENNHNNNNRHYHHHFHHHYHRHYSHSYYIQNRDNYLTNNEISIFDQIFEYIIANDLIYHCGDHSSGECNLSTTGQIDRQCISSLDKYQYMLYFEIKEKYKKNLFSLLFFV
jgi:hypothetical protein